MLDGLIYNMYLWASHKLKADISSTQQILAQQDEDITSDNPSVIREYLSSEDEDKLLLEVRAGHNRQSVMADEENSFIRLS